MVIDVIQQIINFTWYAFNYQISVGNGISFSLWNIIVYMIILYVLAYFVFRILLFFINKTREY